MYKGIFKGNNLTENHNILILGESHHGMEEHIDTTESVVTNYFRNPNKACYKFFDKIVTCFGFTPDEREVFWNKVWFGNYVDKSCGVKTSKAKNLISEHRDTYNRELFEFVNENNIDVIFCFSRLVYNNLPDNASREKFDVPNAGGKRDYINKTVYKSGIIPNSVIELNNQLVVYGFRHPSA